MASGLSFLTTSQKKFHEEDFWLTSHLRSANLLVDKVKVCGLGQCIFVSLDLRLKVDIKSPLVGSTTTIDIGDVSVSNFAIQSTVPSGYLIVDGKKDETKKSGVSFVTTHHDIVYQN